MPMTTRNMLQPDERNMLLTILETRFDKHPERHQGVDWAAVVVRLDAAPEKLWYLNEMEQTGGEPDVVGQDETGAYLFVDCSAESPSGRRSLCYDQQALESRKANKPAGSAIDQAVKMGIELLDEDQYFLLQQVGAFDTKTSSWLKTPPDVRKQGGAIFGDRRFGRVFIYHNGADAYYAARGFRGLLRV